MDGVGQPWSPLHPTPLPPLPSGIPSLMWVLVSQVPSFPLFLIHVLQGSERNPGVGQKAVTWKALV